MKFAKILMVLGLSAVTLTGMATATPITLSGVTFSEVSPDVTITGGIAGAGSQADPLVLFESITGSDVTIQIDDIRNLGDAAGIGGPNRPQSFWLKKVVTNDSNSVWNYFDHELQLTLGVASSNGDGLQFGQERPDFRPWTSDKFADFTEVLVPRDFINFYNGTVLPGETVEFNYVIAFNDIPAGHAGTFYLRQRPNFSVTIPEPASLALVGLGLLGFGAVRRKHS